MRLTYCFFICFFCFGMPAFCDVMSKYGQIQNVQTYSANPFYNPNGSYNQNFPRLVYANGNDVENADCNRIVLGLLQSYCGTRNGCNGMQLSDVRPTIMVQLSQIPNHNYAVACSGFLDTVFAVYMSEQSNGIQRVNFPTVKKSAVEFSFGDGVPDWESEYKEREMELEQLQSQNARGNGNLTATQFPRTIDDISLQDKMALMGDGLKPYKDNHAYMQLGDVMEDKIKKEQKDGGADENKIKNKIEKEQKDGGSVTSATPSGGGTQGAESENSRGDVGKADESGDDGSQCYDLQFFKNTQLDAQKGTQIAELYLQKKCGEGWHCGIEYGLFDDYLYCSKGSGGGKLKFRFDDLKEKKEKNKKKSVFDAGCRMIGGYVVEKVTEMIGGYVVEKVTEMLCGGLGDCSVLDDVMKDFYNNMGELEEVQYGENSFCRMDISSWDVQ